MCYKCVNKTQTDMRYSMVVVLNDIDTLIIHSDCKTLLTHFITSLSFNNLFPENSCTISSRMNPLIFAKQYAIV